MGQESDAEVLVMEDDFAWLATLLVKGALQEKRKKKIPVCVSGGRSSPIHEEELQEDDEKIDIVDDDPVELEELGDGAREDEHAPKTKDLLHAYLDDVGRWNVLSAEEERELAVRKEAGDKQAKDLLIKHNLRLVVSIAKRFIGGGLPLEDLIQEGNIGLMKGVEKFRVDEGYKLSTYATWWIRQKIQRLLLEKARMIRLPVHANELLSRRKKAIRKLTDESGNPPKLEELAVELRRSYVEYGGKSFELFCDWLRRVEKIAEDMFSLDYPVGEDGDATMIDFVDSGKPSPEDIVADAEIRRKLIEPVLARMTNRERQIIRRRFGFDGEEETLEEIGDSLGVTRERIRQIEVKALRKIRFHFYSQKQRKAEALVVIRGA